MSFVRLKFQFRNNRSSAREIFLWIYLCLPKTRPVNASNFQIGQTKSHTRIASPHSLPPAVSHSAAPGSGEDGDGAVGLALAPAAGVGDEGEAGGPGHRPVPRPRRPQPTRHLQDADVQRHCRHRRPRRRRPQGQQEEQSEGPAHGKGLETPAAKRQGSEPSQLSRVHVSKVKAQSFGTIVKRQLRNLSFVSYHFISFVTHNLIYKRRALFLFRQYSFKNSCSRARHILPQWLQHPNLSRLTNLIYSPTGLEQNDEKMMKAAQLNSFPGLLLN